MIQKLAQVGELALDHKAHVILDGGDLFHHKAPSRTSHALVQRLLDTQRAYPCPVLHNIGNHDCKYGDPEYLDESPLGVVIKGPNAMPCFGSMEVFLQETPLGVTTHRRVSGEWQGPPPSGSGLRVQVVGIPYHGVKYQMSHFEALKKDADWLVCMAHCLASPGGGSMFESEDIISYDTLHNYAPDVFCFGHWHKDQGITDLGGGKHVVNTGSLTRGSISQEEISRTPSVVLVTLDQNVSLTKIPLKVQPADQVFNLDRVSRKLEQETTVSTVVDNLLTTLRIHHDSNLLDEARSWAIAGEALDATRVRERVLNYLERANATKG